MAETLYLEDVDDELVRELRKRADQHGRTPEAEHRDILRQALQSGPAPSFGDLAAEMRKLTSDRQHTPSEILLRQTREEN